MATRREVLTTGIRLGAAAVLTTGSLLGELIQAATPTATQTPAHPDEMTVNSAPQHVVYPPPDFGPAPHELPIEALAVAGSHSLKAAGLKHGTLTGAAVVVRSLKEDPVLAELIVDQCGILVPEGELKWIALRPSADQFNFAPSDALFDFAMQHHLKVRGHTLAWHNSVPTWLQNAPQTTDVRTLFVEHIRTVMTRYRGRVHSWDVVNEAILPADKMPGSLRNSFWYDRVGADYIDLAFHTARAADPRAKLTYNDYGVEYDNAEHTERRAAILALLRGMQERKVPLDAVGIQAHVKANQPDTIGKGLADYIEALRAMNLEVYLTELDVNEDDIVTNDPVERDRIVAQTYSNLLDVSLANPAVKLVLTWGISDRRTWLNDGPTHHRKQPNRPQRSLPFDPQYRPAPAFFAMRDSLNHRNTRQPSGR